MEYKKILISCGELSGEMHTANLVRQFKKLNNCFKFYAIGSKMLKDLGCKILIDYHEISIIGITEIVKKFFFIKKRIDLMKKFIRDEKPDLVILVDFPGFNFILAKYAKKLKLKVVYFIPPQIWVWQYKRINKIRKYCDLVIPTLPFERAIYKKENIEFVYYGHPVSDNIKVTLTKKQFYKKFKIPDNKKIIALLPGSRNKEIHDHLPFLLETAVKLEKKYNDLFFVMNAADTIGPSLIMENLKKYNIKNIILVQKQNYNLFNAAFAGVLVSGTVTLEASFLKLPMAVIYRTDPLFYLIVKYLLIKVKFVSLVNLIAGREVVKELLQKELTADNIVNEMDKILLNTSYRKNMIGSLIKVKRSVYNKDVTKKIAKKLISGFL